MRECRRRAADADLAAGAVREDPERQLRSTFVPLKRLLASRVRAAVVEAVDVFVVASAPGLLLLREITSSRLQPTERR